ncbi:MAG TPA: tRNA adenosine deaminase-associated protein [Mycobacteriales bacterium]|nr:tRNA adenosine deaminase-associated protein [Mycobacteriales bacterium]
MTYAAAAIARADAGWYGDELDLDGVEDLDGVVELLRETVGDDASTALLFVEEDDEWFAILRVDSDDEPRVFVSDARVVATSEIAGLFAEAAIEIDPEEDEPGEDETADDEDDEGTRADGDPVGDSALLSDLGTSSARLLGLCAEEGALPSDVISALCESAGCLDVLEKLRGV